MGKTKKEQEVLKLSDENFEKEVLQSNTPVLVGFWRQGCGACSSLPPVLKEVSKSIGTRARVGELNIFENPEIAKKYKIPAVPTLIIFKRGEAKEKAVGLREKQVLINKLISLI